MPLTDEASDAFDAFESAYPDEAMHFDSIVQHLQDRFHGSETLEKFKKEFNLIKSTSNCNRHTYT